MAEAPVRSAALPPWPRFSVSKLIIRRRARLGRLASVQLAFVLAVASSSGCASQVGGSMSSTTQPSPVGDRISHTLVVPGSNASFTVWADITPSRNSALAPGQAISIDRGCSAPAGLRYFVNEGFAAERGWAGYSPGGWYDTELGCGASRGTRFTDSARSGFGTTNTHYRFEVWVEVGKAPTIDFAVDPFSNKVQPSRPPDSIFLDSLGWTGPP
jgi:hypothetical protein